MSRREPARPERPMLPPALWALAAVWLAQRVVFAWSFGAQEAQLSLVLWCSLVLAGLLVVVSAVLRLRTGRLAMGVPLLIASVCVVGVATASMACRTQRRAVATLAKTPVSAWSIDITGDPSEGEHGFRTQARAWIDGAFAGELWLSSQQRLERGLRIACVGRYEAPAEDDYGRSSWSQGICGSVRVVKLMERQEKAGPLAAAQRLRERLLASICAGESDERALLAGCVCGSREELRSRGLVDAFARCGLAHLVAVSGAHLAVLSTLVAHLLEACGIGQRGRVAALVLITGLFAVFCGLPVTVVRAWLMAVVASASQLVGRRSHALSSVCVVALVMALASPAATGQLGFGLSVLSVVGLCVFSPYVGYAMSVALPAPSLPHGLPLLLRKLVFGMADGVRELLVATTICQLVTLPLTLPAFGRLAIVAPLANLVVGPLFAPVLGFGLLSCLLAWAPGVSGLALAASDLVCKALLVAVQGLGSLPYASIPASAVPTQIVAALALLPLACFVFWPRVSRMGIARVVVGFAAGCGLLWLSWRHLAPARIVVLDVGQGDAVLIQDGSSAVLVDAGPEDAVVEALGRAHVLHLDAVVVTHLHDDHYGGIEHLSEVVRCDRVVVADGVAGAMDAQLASWCRELTGRAPTEIGYGDVLRIGGFEARMVWPRERVDGSENAHSIELVISYEKSGATLSALLTGDAEHAETGACVSAGDVGDIDVLKVGHHGSDVSLTPELAASLDPEVSVASAGENNSYGHPTRACVEVLEEAGSRFLCTKDVGDVELRPGREGVAVRCRNGP